MIYLFKPESAAPLLPLSDTKYITYWMMQASQASHDQIKISIALRPMSIVPFFKNAPLSRQFLHKLKVFSWKIIVKAKKSAVPFLSNCCLKIFFGLFLGFSMYLMFKIKIFKMQLETF